MNSDKGIVIDANILLRAVFGRRAFRLLSAYAEKIDFLISDHCVAEVQKYFPTIAKRKGLALLAVEAHLRQILSDTLRVVDEDSYGALQARALERIGIRDENDWPALALALLTGAPIWTEDQDFFGCGIATWVTATVEIYLRSS